MKNVIQISEASSLAFHGMGLLAMRRGRISVHEMAALIGSSEAHLSKVFQRLSREGFVSSVRGPGGGFILDRPAEEITMLQIYSAIEGEPSSNPCIMSKDRCPFNGCIFRDLIPEVTERFLRYLSQTTLAEMIDTKP